MSRPVSEQSIRKIPSVLANLLGVEEKSLVVRELNGPSRYKPSCIVKYGPHLFVIEYKAPGTPGRISQAIRPVREFTGHNVNLVRIVATSHMGEKGADLCQEANVSWLDLSGNARIIAKGLNINVRGRKNMVKQRGRRANLFSPRSSNIARQLLFEYGKPFTQQELAIRSGLDRGYTSRIVKRLDEEGFIKRDRGDKGGKIWLPNPELLLEAWRDEYDFQKHQIFHGHVASRSGESTQSQVSRALRGLGEEHFATGLGAAWLYNKFTSFRMTTIYLRDYPSKRIRDAIKVDMGEEGANLWMVVPCDRGVLDGRRVNDEIPIVSPIQTYLDLKSHPERASEAAAELRKTHLTWSRNG